MTVTAFNMISIIDLCVVWLEGKWTRLFSIDGRQNPIRVVGRVPGWDVRFRTLRRLLLPELPFGLRSTVQQNIH